MVDFLILSSRFHIISPDSFSLGEIKSEKEIPEKRGYKDLLKKIMKQYLAPSLSLRFWKIKYLQKLLQIIWALFWNAYLFILYPIRLSIGDTFPTLHICS